MPGTGVGRSGVVVVEAVQHQPQVTTLLGDRQILHRVDITLERC
jgi:hypothetical protein